MDNLILGPSIRIPDSITPIRAWKGLVKTSDDQFVSPTISGVSWVLGQTNKADCPVKRQVILASTHYLTIYNPEAMSHVSHDVPAEGCTCGFYALKSPGFRFWRWWALSNWGIPARVELYGKVIEHKRGYRAEYAKLIRVYPSARWIIRSSFWWPALTLFLVTQQWRSLLISLGGMVIYNLFMSWCDQRKSRR